MKNALALTFVVLLATAGANAEMPRPLLFAQSSEPQATTATFGAWTVRCETVSGKAAQKLCEATFAGRTDAKVTAQIAVAKPEPKSTVKVVALLPLNSELSVQPSLNISGDILKMTWRRCISGGCMAEIVLPSSAIESFIKEGADLNFDFATAMKIKFKIPKYGLESAIAYLKRA